MNYYPKVTRQKNWPPKVGDNYCTEFSVPAIASQLTNEIAPGAVLKHAIDERYRAMLIDWVGDSPEAVAVVVYLDDYSEEDWVRNVYDPKKKQLKREFYRIELINLDEWIALTLGQDDEMFVP